MSKNLHVGIVGSGIQGVSNALFLQKKGFKVTIFDRDNPGSPAASYGNAGHFSPYASLCTLFLSFLPPKDVNKFFLFLI